MVYIFRLLQRHVCKPKPQLHTMLCEGREINTPITQNSSSDYNARSSSRNCRRISFCGWIILHAALYVVFTLNVYIIRTYVFYPQPKAEWAAADMQTLCTRKHKWIYIYTRIIKSASDCVTHPAEHLSLHNPNAIHSLWFVLWWKFDLLAHHRKYTKLQVIFDQ